MRELTQMEDFMLGKIRGDKVQFPQEEEEVQGADDFEEEMKQDEEPPKQPYLRMVSEERFLKEELIFWRQGF